VDLPGVLDFKARVLDGAGPACDRTAVPADLRGDWRAALGGAGFDPGIPTAWLAEGLLVYLTEADAAGLFTAIPAVPGSALAFESGGGAFLDRARSVTDFSALWKGGMRDPAGWLSAHGWIPEFHPLEAFARQVGRPISGTTDEGFLTASPSPPAAAPSSP
ncbi:MAG: SAM-dependent methyltransferase, partial [Nonomuraea sp.]|nr:SAM-dependent methyltransferase [Nonomuraea sp.]